MRALITIAVVLGTTTAALAAPSFELVDRGDAVEVIAHDVKATTTTIHPTRQRLEIPVVGRPLAKPVAAHDGTVMAMEIQGSSAGPVMSVKLVFDRAKVQTMARYAQATQVGEDLHLIFPKTVPMDGAVVKLPTPTLSPELAAKAAAAAPKVTVDSGKPETSTAPKPEATPVVAKTEPTMPVAKPEAAPAPAPLGKPTPAKLGSAPEGNTSKLGIYGVAGLMLVGVGGYAMRKKKANFGGGPGIEVIAQRSIGPKAKIVWLAAGSREMVVAVTAQQVRMLGAWKKGDAPSVPVPANGDEASTRAIAALPEARSLPSSKPVAETTDVMETMMPTAYTAVTRPVPTTKSPAVAGLLKLRGKVAPIEQLVNDEVATGDLDADALWAKEILSATTSPRK